MLKEAVNSECEKVRFGADFCNVKIPSLSTLKEAYTLTIDGGKEFSYITPRIPEFDLEKVQEHLEFLNNKAHALDVIINDFGTFNIMGRYTNLKPHLGRQLIYVPARCPCVITTGLDGILLSLKHVRNLYLQTNLSYSRTMNFFRNSGIEAVDVDWIPQCFPHFDFLVRNGLDLCIHMHLIPVTMTRKCHMARFLGEKKPETCLKPCNTKAFMLKNEGIKLKLYLNGNAVFRVTQPSKKDVRKLTHLGVGEFVINTNPITKMRDRKKIDQLITKIKHLGSS